MAGFRKDALFSVGYPTVKKFRITAFILVVTFYASGCEHELSREDYIQWVTNYDNGLHVRKNVNEFVFDLQYKPVDLVNLERKETNVQDSLKYFTLKIGEANQQDLLQHGASDIAAVQQNLYYYSYLFQNSIFLEYNGIKFPCVLYHFERSDSKNRCVFNLGFEAPAFEDEAEIYVEIASDKLYSLPVRLKINLNNVPKLQI
jgi:hypothetical protein